MKKSVFNLCWFVFVVALSLLLPVYILLSGSTTLLPASSFMVSAFAAMNALGFLGVAITLRVALGKGKNKQAAGDYLAQTWIQVSELKTWRKVFEPLRLVASALLFLALGLPGIAASIILGFVSILCAFGLLKRYNDKYVNLKPFVVTDCQTFISDAVLKKGVVDPDSFAIRSKDVRPDI